MSVLVQGAKRLFGSGDDVSTRVRGLEQAATAARGRLDDDSVDQAMAVVERAGERLRLSAQHTVVALAGATGSGKSSLFNRLSGLELAAVGVRRPTTSETLACAWGPDGVEEILDWLGIPGRHQVSRLSSLDAAAGDGDLRGLVLLDLPDHDSTEVEHHLEVDRLVRYADLLVWVLDPQKYADAAVHDRYLKPMATHSDVIVVVLNHIDELSGPQRRSALDDVRRLLAADGLAGVPVLATSATTGEGLPELQRLLGKRIRAKEAARERLGADVSAAAQRLAQLSGSKPAPGIDTERRAGLERALAAAAGVEVVVAAVERSVRQRTGASTGFPLTRWLVGLRRDPLRRLHLGGDVSLPSLPRSSVPAPTSVQQAGVDVAVRNLAEGAARGLAPPWAAAVRRASLAHRDDLHDALDQAVVGTELGVGGTPWWARFVNAVQWVLFAVAVAGALWLAGLAALALLRITPPVPPDEYGIPVPTLALVAGVLIGLALAFVARLLTRVVARAKARRADRMLRAAISGVAHEQVLEPVAAELAAYDSVRAGLGIALRR